MGKYESYKNRVEMFLSSEKGKRVLNFCYSWGASIVILGAMFKILYLPYGNVMLAIGMITEFLVFFVFGFERPNSDYHWEDVFPVLKSKNPLDKPSFASSPASGGTYSGAGREGGGAAPVRGGAAGETAVNMENAGGDGGGTVNIGSGGGGGTVRIVGGGRSGVIYPQGDGGGGEGGAVDAGGVVGGGGGGTVRIVGGGRGGVISPEGVGGDAGEGGAVDAGGVAGGGGGGTVRIVGGGGGRGSVIPEGVSGAGEGGIVDAGGVVGGGTVRIVGGGGGRGGVISPEGVGGAGESGAVDAGGVVGGGGTIHLGGGLGGVNVSEEDSESLSSSIKKLNEAAEQISKMADFTEATQKYMEQLSAMSEQIEKFSTVTHSLTDVSDGINRNSQNYVQQMELLNRNITGLNTIYEVQLKSISSQISSIEHINAGLNRIKDLYDGSIVDSSVFRSETERMAQQLTQLNTVYARLLQAMTVNMGMPVPNPYQVPFTPAPAEQPGK